MAKIERLASFGSRERLQKCQQVKRDENKCWRLLLPSNCATIRKSIMSFLFPVKVWNDQ